MKKSLFQSGVLLHGGRCRTQNAGFLRSFSVVLLLLPLLFAQTAYGDINTELFKAAETGNTAEIEQLLRKGADVNVKANDGHTALMVAAFLGYTEIVKALIDAGVDVNAKNKDEGLTALKIAAISGHTDIVDILKRAGARQ